MTNVAIDPTRIRERAHALWLARGCAPSSAEQDWFEAERAIVAEEAARRGSPADVAVLEPAVAPPPATPARNVARPRIAPSAAVPPTAALSPSAHGDLRREARGERAKLAAPAPARPASERAKPPRTGVQRSSDTRAARAESELPPRAATAARAGKGSKAAPGSRAKRPG